MSVSPWVTPAALAAVLVGAHYLTLRASAGKLPDALGAFLVEGTAAAGLLVLVVVLPGARQVGEGAGRGAMWAAASGLCISGMMMLLFASLRRGGPVAATGTLVLGGGVTLSALAAPLLFGEPFTARRAVGVALGLAGMVVLSSE
jgi:bacterial/archaeal transporter family protein